MKRQEIIEALSRVDLFECIRPETLATIVGACPTLSLRDGELLCAQGAEGDSFYIVLEGLLQVFRGDRVIAAIEPYECVGELALLDAAPRSATVRALGNATLLEVPSETFNTYLRNEPETLVAIMRTVAGRLRRTLDDTQAAYEHVSMLVHDMLNLLNALSGAEAVLDDLSPDDDNRWFLEHILATQRLLETMMRGALRKSSGAAAAYRKTRTRMDSLVHECMKRDIVLHPDLEHVHVEVKVETALAPFPCNPIDVRRVVANLLINAGQALPAGGVVVVTIRQDPDRVTLSVSDDGIGVPEHIQSLIFEPHFTTKPNGNGLGLSSCRHIVERLHGGKLTCRSVEGGGTTFCCEFPAETAELGLRVAPSSAATVPAEMAIACRAG
jgi:signal transduction histidine kinase